MNSLSFTIKKNFKAIFILTIILGIISIIAYRLLVPQYEIYEVKTENHEIAQFFYQFEHFDDFKGLGEFKDKLTWAFNLREKITLVFYFEPGTQTHTKISILQRELQQHFVTDKNLAFENIFSAPVSVGILPNMRVISTLCFMISFFLSNFIILFLKGRSQE